MSRETEKFIRRAYQVSGEKDIADRVSLFTDDGAFAGESIEVVHRGP